MKLIKYGRACATQKSKRMLQPRITLCLEYCLIFRQNFRMKLPTRNPAQHVYLSALVEAAPKVQLKPLDQRQTTKKFYIGNLTELMAMNKLVLNMKQIYAEEIRDEIIHNIDAHLNTWSWKTQNKLHTENLQHQRRKSACVVITST